MIERKKLYRFPWSKTDNPGGWIEVTDICDMQCPGCYRSQIEGHRELQSVIKDIEDTASMTNCDCITIAGGEPLGYPHLPEVVRFIRNMKIKPIILSNGLLLTPEMALELKKAGLSKIHLHIDSAQKREGWAGKTEAELNELRQYYADNGIAPMVRRLCKETGCSLQRIYELFPSGPAKGACKVAGLPKPDGCV